MTSDPPSPMKIRAGGRLKTRKPPNDPANSPNWAAMNHWPFTIVAVIRIRAAIAPSPPERPSMLSRKFIALVTSTIQRTVTTMLARSPGVPHHSPSAAKRRTSKKVATTTATPTWSPSLSSGPSALRSSMSPITCRTAAPPRSAQAVGNASRNLASKAAAGGTSRKSSSGRNEIVKRAKKTGAAKPQKMATPPMLGTLRRTLTCPAEPAESSAPTR